MVAVTTHTPCHPHSGILLLEMGRQADGFNDLLKDSVRKGIVEVQAQAWGSATMASLPSSCFSNSGAWQGKGFCISPPAPQFRRPEWPGQPPRAGPRGMAWDSTLTPVHQPDTHSARTYVPGLSICAAGPAGEQPGPALALEVPLTSPGLHSPSQAKMRLSRSPKVYSNPRSPQSHPQDINGEMGRMWWKGRKKGGVRQEEMGRASAVPTGSPGLPYPKLSHLRAFPGFPPA